MTSGRTTVGLVQVGEMVWERRPPRQFHLVDGALRPKPIPKHAQAASLAYLPLAVGTLEAYAAHHAQNADAIDFLLPQYQRLTVDRAVERLLDSDVAGFSVYVWNVGLSLATARELKRRRPQTLIVFGGPQVPDDAEEFLRAHPFVDLACHGEGERTFTEILDRHAEHDWDGIASTSWIDDAGRFRAQPRRERMKDLDEIPSPMLKGVYEKLMRSAPDQQWLGLWETNRGCPFRCAFCDWGSATGGKVARYSEERLFAEIEWLAEHEVRHLFVCDANFGMLRRDLEIAQRLADAYASRRLPVAISVQGTKNRPDRSEEIQRVFKRSRVVSFGASISLQSVDADVLRAIRRDNISLEAFDRLQRHYASEGLDTYTDLIVGLPGESYESFTRGVDDVIRGGQLNRVAFYECFVLPNAPMAAADYREQFALETVPIRIARVYEDMEVEEPWPDYIEMVVASSTMTRDDWLRMRVFAHLVEMLFYDRLLHVPFCLLGLGAGLGFREMIEAFMDADPDEAPATASAVRALEGHARWMLEGGPQYAPSSEWLGVWWPVDQYALIGLARGERLFEFYDEASGILDACARRAGLEVDEQLIGDAIALNRERFVLPFQLMNDVLETAYPVAEDYEALLAGRPALLAPQPSACRIEREASIWMSWDDWCKDLMRRLYLRGGYLYPVQALNAIDALAVGA